MNNYPLRSKKRDEGKVWDLSIDSSDDEVAARKKKKRCKVPIIHPGVVVSSCDGPSKLAFDEEDFEELRQRYLLPRITLKSELPGGMTLRKTEKARLIDQKTPGFKKLRRAVDDLVKKNDKLEIYNLLCQVRSFEINPNRVPVIMQETNKDGDVTELYDLTTQGENNDDAEECVNVDDYIADVLLPQQTAPEYVMSANIKRERIDGDASLSLSAKKSIVEDEQPGHETPTTPKHTKYSIAHVTPEKPLELNSGVIETHLVSANTSRSSTPSEHASNPACPANMKVKSNLFRDQESGGVLGLQRELPKNDKRSVHQKKGRDGALAKRDQFLSRMNQRNVCILSVSVMPNHRAFVPQKTHVQQLSLAKEWRSQSRRRRRGEWIPSGHKNGRWKKPSWAGSNGYGVSIKKASAGKKKGCGCKKSLLQPLQSLVATYIKASSTSGASNTAEVGPFKSLQDVSCPAYFDPTTDLLRRAHRALDSLLPEGDCETFDVVKLAREYYNYWRPEKVKVILLAESHAHTDKERAFGGPIFNGKILKDSDYQGPCNFISLVYCLAYGENECLIPYMKDKTNKGTTQFWTLFASISRGVDHIAQCSKKATDFASPFAADVLKGGGLACEDRLRAKFDILTDLKKRGIWLLDVSIFGWYISQPQKYQRSSISNEIHRMSKTRPPLELKAPSLVLSWELYTKHLIRQVATEGHLKLLIPIGMEVESAITRQRLDDAISPCAGAKVTDTFPAPNAWIPGGYGPFHAKLAEVVEKAAPRRNGATLEPNCNVTESL